MNSKQFLALFAFVILLALIAACVPEHAVVPQSTTPSTAIPSARTNDAAPTPTIVAVPAADEEDCMAGCHKPDPNESFAAGAKPQPPSHAGRTTCLNCHSTLQNPALPATHLGRLDPSCALCHVANSPTK